MLNKKSIRKYGLTLSIAALCLVVLSGTALGVGPGYAQSSAPAVKENHPVIKDDGLISPRIVDLTKAVQSGNRAAVEEFWQQVTKTGAPIVEPIAGDDRYSFVTFLWRAKAETHNVGIFGGLAGIEMLYMSRLLDTDLWYRTFKVRNDARFTYNLSPNDSEVPINKVDLKDIKAVMKRISTFTIDPLNPHKFASAPPTSMVELPGAPPQPWIARGAGVPERKVEQKKLKSAILNNERNIWVYTPAGFNATGADYDLLVLFDGIAYTQWVPTPV
ncbi:MAG: enterochelin esterase domain-containing protein, partial [Blastocatellia bacterium]